MLRPVLDNDTRSFPSGAGRVVSGIASAELTASEALNTLSPSLRQRKHAMVRETRYARNGSASIAFQTFGSGPLDLVLGLGWLSNLDAVWEEPRYAQIPEWPSLIRSCCCVRRQGYRSFGCNSTGGTVEPRRAGQRPAGRDRRCEPVRPRPWSVSARAGSPSRILRRYIPSVSGR